MDLSHCLDKLKNQLASVAFCRNTGVYNVRNGTVISSSEKDEMNVQPSLN